MSSSDVRSLLTRRQFGVGSLGTITTSPALGLAAGETVAVESTILSDYAHRPDPATRMEPVSDGDLAGGRYRTCRLPGGGPGPSDAVKTLAVAANAAGLPAAVVRQVPFQPMFDGLKQDDLIAHTFVEFVRTGGASWPLLLPMVKSAVEAMTAAGAIARDAWQLGIERFVLTGGSKRGWTTWLTASVHVQSAG